MEEIPNEKRLAYSVSELCRSAGITRALFYKLLKDDRGPREVLKPYGSRKTLIPVDAAEEWLNSMRVSASSVFGKNKQRRAA